MTNEAQYSFDLSPAQLDALRSHLLAAQRHHMDRARDMRGMRVAEDLRTAIVQAEASADEARRLWALLAGVRSARFHGTSPVGHVEADKLLRFLSGGS